jgi:hypothetical protein
MKMKTPNKPDDVTAWPEQSSTCLPALHRNLLAKQTFAINEECVSLMLSPSGRLLTGGFADGTCRLFDLTGRYSSNHKENSLPNKRSALVESKYHQQFGAVTCQVGDPTKGFHSSLLMEVDVTQDSLWAFAGVLRGSNEMVALYLGHLEASFDTLDDLSETNLLDQIEIYKHNDPKTRGFGACTRLRNSSKYLLFTGKGIKSSKSTLTMAFSRSFQQNSLIFGCLSQYISGPLNHPKT